MPAPLTTRDVKLRKGSDELRSLKRRAVGLARLDRDVLHLEEGPVLVRIRRFTDPHTAVAALRDRGRLDRAMLEKVAEVEAPPLPIERTMFAALEHDLIVLRSRAAQVVAREHRKVFARFDGLEPEWLDEKAARIDILRHAVPPISWTDAVVELITALRGAEEGRRSAKAFATVEAEPAERRAKALERVLAIAEAMETGTLAEMPNHLEAHEREPVQALYERLDAVRDWPGRAKRRRTLHVLRRAIGWTELPESFLGEDFVASAKRAIAMWPLARDDEAAAQLAMNLCYFRLGSDDAPVEDLAKRDASIFHAYDLTAGAAVTLEKLAGGQDQATRSAVAKLVVAGLDLELLRIAAAHDQLEDLTQVDDVRAATAFLTWSSRLRDHYSRHKLAFTVQISPQLFRSLPRNEDLSVLTLCLLEQHAEPTSDPIATLDATLGLFQRLPGRGKRLLEQLRHSPAGEGRRLDPRFAAFVDDDALLDRSVYVAQLAGEPAISAAMREDFLRHELRAVERKHLAGLAVRTERQAQRLIALDVPTNEARPDRTRRRLRTRIEELLPQAYRRALDETFRGLLREGWNILLPKLTDTWRETVRFWLLVEENRDYLETLLREAAQRPGQCIKDAFPANAEWIASMRRPPVGVDIDAWLAPRRDVFEHAGARFTIALEEDPLEVLRMGIPFGTCLSLDGGTNARSTVLNAVEANKRVLYVRNAAGKIVGRKLLGLTDLGRLVGYRLYRSLGKEESRAVRQAVAKFCDELATACREPFITNDAPRRLHPGYWYDDGSVAFEGKPGPLPEFCRAHGLAEAPANLDDEALHLEAEGWCARETNDLELARRVLDNSGDSPAMRAHDRWIVERLGYRRAIRESKDDTSLCFALFHSLAVDEAGGVRAIEAASRLPERCAHHGLEPALRRCPPSAKINAALVELALRAARRGSSASRGHIAITMQELPGRFEDVASALDLIDAVEPAWSSERWRREQAVAHAVDAIEALYEVVPDPSAVTTALMSRRRGGYAHRAVLRIAARHVVPGGERALQRLAALRPELMSTPDGFAALLRQSNGAIDAAPIPEASPFAALRELVALPSIHRFLGPWDTLDGEPANTWEAAWRRRRRKDPGIGYDAVRVERARRVLVDSYASDEQRAKARALVLDAKDGEVVDWIRLASACARRGDAETARLVLEEVVFKTAAVPLPMRLVVDLWRLGARATVTQSFKLTARAEWSERVEAAERAGAAGLLEAVALELALTSPSVVVSPCVPEQLARGLGAIVREAAAWQVSAVFVHLEDAFSVMAFRDALATVPAARVAEIKHEIRRYETKGARSETFFSWIRDIGGIESA